LFAPLGTAAPLLPLSKQPSSLSESVPINIWPPSGRASRPRQRCSSSAPEATKDRSAKALKIASAAVGVPRPMCPTARWRPSWTCLQGSCKNFFWSGIKALAGPKEKDRCTGPFASDLGPLSKQDGGPATKSGLARLERMARASWRWQSLCGAQ